MKHLLFVIAWLWVALPLSWGVLQSAYKSMPLFFQPKQHETPPAQEKAPK